MVDTATRAAFQTTDNDILVYNCDHTENYYLDCPDVYSAIQKDSSMVVSVYNPMAERQALLKLKIPKKHLLVEDIRRKETLLSDIFCDVISDDFCELYVSVHLPQLSYTYLKLSFGAKKDYLVKRQQLNSHQMKRLNYKNKEMVLSVSLDHGALALNLQQASREPEELRVSYKYVENQNGGAYVFTS